ncbi:hypothetical protein [Streptomyces malaysiensis]
MTLSSARGDEHLKTMLKALPAYRGIARVSDLEDRARQAARLKAT